jgi:hypothetical protein
MPIVTGQGWEGRFEYESALLTRNWRSSSRRGADYIRSLPDVIVALDKANETSHYASIVSNHLVRKSFSFEVNWRLISAKSCFDRVRDPLTKTLADCDRWPVRSTGASCVLHEL